ncbi:COGs COG3558 [hydrothermal vent metagenome]|uniref:COGs COG3558 n=1 Tax=hydrothermal vent metagenome TaxID=652676 RepID=A0A3B0S754_9ZZZZ
MTRPPLPPFTLETARQKVRAAEEGRKFHWPQGRRPDDHPGLSDLGL